MAVRTSQSVVQDIAKKDIKAIEARIEEANKTAKELVMKSELAIGMLHPKKDVVKISQLAGRYQKQINEVKKSVHLDKCIVKTLKHFDTTPERIDAFLKANIESGIDGFPVEDIIGRHGYFDGKQKSRNMVAEFYKKQPYTIELVEQKIKALLKKPDAKPTAGAVGTL